MPQTRQLAAIMFTDIVGYTALMGKDEAKAFELLEKNRGIHKPIIEQYQGRWIKELGDGVMASFQTVSDAVNAAIAIQRKCNAAQEYKLRIGIHLGEVVFENEDVFGDGVNIASRIQAIAAPGSIFVSESVQHNVSNKKDLITQYIRTVKLKNVRSPVRIYQVIADGVDHINAGSTRKSGLARVAARWVLPAILLITAGFLSIRYLSNRKNFVASDEKSIAVLPFTDLSPGKDQEYLGDGLAEEIINSISIIQDLKVRGRTSSFQFRGMGLDAREIGRKLDVNYILEGSIQKSGNILRFITQLIRVDDNSTVWSQRFDKEFSDIFAIQDTIAFNIVEKLKLTLSDSERPRLIKHETDPEVYALYLKGLHTYKKFKYQESIKYNMDAIAIDSMFAPSYAYIALSRIWLINQKNEFANISGIREARDFAERSIQLDPGLAEGYSALALLGWTIELDFAAAKKNFERSVQLNPSASLIKNRYGYFLVWMGDFDKAETMGREAMNLDPADYNGYVIVARALIYKKEFREAGKLIEEGGKLFPEIDAFLILDIIHKYFTGMYDKIIARIGGNARKERDDYRDDDLVYLYLSYLKKEQPVEASRVFQKLKVITPGTSPSAYYNLARIYAHRHMNDSAYYYLQRSFDTREKEFKLLKIDPLLDPVRKDERYMILYKKYGFDRYQ